METSEIIVLVVGILLIGGILWYFFGDREKAEAKVSVSGTQDRTYAVGDFWKKRDTGL